MIRHENVVAIPGASSVEQLAANAGAAEVELTDGEAAQLGDAADRFEPVGGTTVVRGLAESAIDAVRSRLSR